MKKFILLLVGIFILLAFTACGGDDSAAEPPPPPPAATPTPAPEPSPPPEPTPAPEQADEEDEEYEEEYLEYEPLLTDGFAGFTQLENPNFTHIMPNGIGFVMPSGWNYEIDYNYEHGFAHIIIDRSVPEIGINMPLGFRPDLDNPIEALLARFTYLKGHHGGEGAEVIMFNHGAFGNIIFAAEFFIPFGDIDIYSLALKLSDGYQHTYIFANFYGDYVELAEVIDEFFVFAESIRFVDPQTEVVVGEPDVVETEPDAAQDVHELVGRWVFENDSSWVTTFYADGTGRHARSWGFGTTFEWSTSRGNLRWIYPGYAPMNTPIRISGDVLYITMADGAAFRYLRD